MDRLPNCQTVKAVIFLCLLSPLFFGCGELFSPDNPATIDGKPRVSYYQQKAVNDMAAVYNELPPGIQDREACIQIMSRFVADPLHPTNFDTAPPLSETEVDLLADTLNDYPQLVDKISNVAYRFDQTILTAIRDLPVVINGTQYLPDAEGYYDLPGGPVHGMEYLQAMQEAKIAPDKHSSRGFSYIQRDIFGRWYDRGLPWPGATIEFFMGNPDSDTDARRNRITASFSTITRATGINLRMWSRGPKLFRRTRYRIRLAKWALGLHQTVLVWIKTESSPGTATVGKMKRSKLRYNHAVVDSDAEEDERTRQHEIGHVLGMIHEHQRYDRDTYITHTVKDDGRNMDKIDRVTFGIFFGGETTTYNTPYDYNSLMHYPYWLGIKILNADHELRGKEGRARNRVQYGHLNADSWMTPWDIYSVRCMYSRTPNPRPEYIPGTDLGRRVTYTNSGGTGSPPFDPRYYAAGYTVTVKEQGTVQRAGYLFKGWTTTIGNYVMVCQPGDTFLMPAHPVTLSPHWVNQVPRRIHYWPVKTGVNHFMRYKFPGGDWSAFPGEPMTFDGTWYTWSRTTNSGFIFAGFFTSSGRRDDNGGAGYTILSNEAWIKDGQVFYTQP